MSNSNLTLIPENAQTVISTVTPQRSSGTVNYRSSGRKVTPQIVTAPSASPPVQSSTSTNTSPVVSSVNQQDSTVQGQLDGLLSKSNPLLQRSYYQGLDHANSRGLLNSSIGGEAAEAAMLDKALPIASQDASTYYDQQKTNQGFQNQFNLSDRQYSQAAEQAVLNRQHDFDLNNNQNAFNANQALLNRQHDFDVNNQQYGFSAQQADLNRQHDFSINAQAYAQASEQAQLDRLYNEAMTKANQAFQQSQMDREVYANYRGQLTTAIQDLVKTTSINISEIQTSANITAEDKATMITQQQELLQSLTGTLSGLYSESEIWQQGWSNYLQGGS